MRPTAFFALVVLLSVGAIAAPSKPNRADNQITHRTSPTAEPQDAIGLLPPKPREKEGPSAADRGPAQRYFVIASEVEPPSELDNQQAHPPAPEKIALDKNIEVPLVHDVQDDSSYKGAQNDSLLYEIKYLNWGAITDEQLKARQGHYFTITFVNDGPRADFVTRFEYRQVRSKETVRTLVQPKPGVRGAARAYFAVVDRAYLTNGPVSAWRFTVLRGDTVVAESKSFLW